MIAVDTNLLVRLLTKDDLSQAKRAAKIMKSDDIFRKFISFDITLP